MKRLTLVLSIAAISASASAKTITVAVIDTGINTSLYKANMLCKYGHKDFTGNGLEDTHGHGSHISGLIDQYAKNIILDKDDEREVTLKKLVKLRQTKIDYCQVILKYYSPKMSTKQNIINTKAAFRYAIDINVDIINYSGGGVFYDLAEAKLVKEALDKGIKVIVAAGNEHCNLDSECHYYPAQDDSRVINVGNLDLQGNRAKTSNYGKAVSKWEIGTNRLSYTCKNPYNSSIISMTGTSQSTAIVTGKTVRSILSK